MALLVAVSNNFIELSLDEVNDFDSMIDLEGLGLARNAPDGLCILKITFVPSAQGDALVVRDGMNGPRIFTAVNVLGTYDILKDEYEAPTGVARGKGKVVRPYIHANECTIAFAHLAYVTFELA